MADAALEKKRPAEQRTRSLLDGRTIEHSFVEGDIIKAADIEQGMKVRTAKPVLMCESDIKAGVRRRSLHVRSSDEEDTSLP